MVQEIVTSIISNDALICSRYATLTSQADEETF